MEVKSGYRQTEIGVIPEDWEVKSLGAICEIAAGRDLVKEDFSPTNDHRHKFPIYSNALSSNGLYGYSKTYQYEPNKITVTARGDVGTAVYRNLRFCAIGRLLVLSSKLDCDLRYVTEYINNFVQFALESTGVPQLTAPQISKYSAVLPPTKAEQGAIAEALSDADALIESLAQLIVKKRQIKQGAMQELLTGKRRLHGFANATIGYKQTEVGVIPEDWLDHTIGDLIDFEGGSQPDKSVFRASWKTGYVRLIQIRDYKTDKYETYVPTHLARRFCNEQDIMIGRYGPPIFQILRGIAVAYNVALIKATPKPQVNHSYAYHFLKQDRLFAFIDKLSQRSSGQTGVDLKELRQYPFPLPPTKAQQDAIAEVLDDLDFEIAALEAKLAKARQLKQGMMHNLLTGRIRLV